MAERTGLIGKDGYNSGPPRAIWHKRTPTPPEVRARETEERSPPKGAETGGTQFFFFPLFSLAMRRQIFSIKNH